MHILLLLIQSLLPVPLSLPSLIKLNPIQQQGTTSHSLFPLFSKERSLRRNQTLKWTGETVNDSTNKWCMRWGLRVSSCSTGSLRAEFQQQPDSKRQRSIMKRYSNEKSLSFLSFLPVPVSLSAYCSQQVFVCLNDSRLVRTELLQVVSLAWLYCAEQGKRRLTGSNDDHTHRVYAIILLSIPELDGDFVVFPSSNFFSVQL